ncbi:MAG: hypothetical protein GY723_00500 [bacterium]|nr:hypothetical protein [bacterium]MCP5066816.1 hypothetical protein [bacterium]
MSSTEFYEVRCERCRTSFAPETKVCVHCGGPLGQSLLFGRIQRKTEPNTTSASSGEMAMPYEHDEDSEELKLQSRGRNVVWILTAVLAMAMSLLRTCGGSG